MMIIILLFDASGSPKKKKNDCYFLSDKPDKSAVRAVSYAIITNNYSRTGTDEYPPTPLSGRPHFAVV